MDIEVHQLHPQDWAASYADYLYAFACKRISDEDTAKDLVQDTFLAALEGIQRFEGKSTERTWLTAILKHKIMDVYRKKASAPATITTHDDDFFEKNGHWKTGSRPQSFGLEQENVLEKKEFITILKSCMQKLPPLWLAVFSMKYMDDEKSDMICDGLKITASNYWVILHRTKLNLRACLQKNDL